MSANRYFFTSSIAATAFAASLIAGSAFADDAAPRDWTGVYVGAYLGGAFGKVPAARVPDGHVLSPSVSAFAAGGLLGANYQWYPIVLGVEGDGGLMTGDASASGVDTGTGSNGHTYTDRTQMDTIYRVRGRVGVDLDRYLFFLAGGESFAKRDVRFTDITTGTDSVKIGKTPTGWNIGIGADYAFTNNMIGRVEFIRDSFSKQRYAFSAMDPDINDRLVGTHLNTVRIALMWEF